MLFLHLCTCPILTYLPPLGFTFLRELYDNFLLLDYGLLRAVTEKRCPVLMPRGAEEEEEQKERPGLKVTQEN